MATNHIARRIATIAIALIATSGAGTAVAATSHSTETRTAKVSAYDFATHIANEGGQDQIDACTGGLTKMLSVSEYMGKDYYPIHNECGGAPILDLAEGHTVHIAELGEFIVVETLDVMRGDDASIIKDMAGEILLQTCHNTGAGMRVVALAAAN